MSVASIAAPPKSANSVGVAAGIARADIVHVFEAGNSAVSFLAIAQGVPLAEFVTVLADPAINLITTALTGKFVVTWGIDTLVRLAAHGYEPVAGVRDLRLLCQVLGPDAGDSLTLTAAAEHFRLSSQDCTTQLRALVALRPAIEAAISHHKLEQIAGLEERSVPAMIMLAAHGIPIDAVELHRQIAVATATVDRLSAHLARLAPNAPPGGWKWGWDQHAGQALRQAGIPLPNTKDATLETCDHPAALAYRDYRHTRLGRSRLESWLKHLDSDDRVRPDWSQIGTTTGRMACANPPVHQLARGAERRIIRAPQGRVLVIADYSQIQMRIVARVTNDPTLSQALYEGRDLHGEIARLALGVTVPSPAQRDWGKRCNFALLFGGPAAARALLPPDSRQSGADAINKLFAACPGLQAWFSPFRADLNGELRTAAGRRVWQGGDLPAATRLSYLAQGCEADGIKTALALLWERRAYAPGSFPVMAIHDEIVVEAPQDQAAAVASLLVACMNDAMAPILHPVPVGPIVPRIVNTWAD